MRIDPPVESPQTHGKAPKTRPDSKYDVWCVMHPERLALTIFNGHGVCRECLQVALDIYHEIALRGFDE